MFPLSPAGQKDRHEAWLLTSALRRQDWPLVGRLVLMTPVGWSIIAVTIVLALMARELIREPTDAGPSRDCRSCAAEPAMSPAAWISTDDYPAAALRANAQGITGVRLTIAPSGRVTSCDISAPSGTGAAFEALDRAACAAFARRARFQPATDGDGQAVKGSWSTRVRWQLPEV